MVVPWITRIQFLVVCPSCWLSVLGIYEYTCTKVSFWLQIYSCPSEKNGIISFGCPATLLVVPGVQTTKISNTDDFHQSSDQELAQTVVLYEKVPFPSKRLFKDDNTNIASGSPVIWTCYFYTALQLCHFTTTNKTYSQNVDLQPFDASFHSKITNC